MHKARQDHDEPSWSTESEPDMPVYRDIQGGAESSGDLHITLRQWAVWACGAFGDVTGDLLALAVRTACAAFSLIVAFARGEDFPDGTTPRRILARVPGVVVFAAGPGTALAPLREHTR